MRKVRPQDVKQDFADFVAERLAYFQRVETLLLGTQHEKRDISTLSATTLHAVYVAFECFLSDLFLAYMNRDFSQYQANLRAKIATSNRDKFGQWAESRINFSTVAHIKIEQIESILNPESFNLTFKSVDVLKQRANEWLADPLRNGITEISEPDARLIDCVHAIRNFIAHQSPNAKSRMNTALAGVVQSNACPNLHLGRGRHDVHDIGAFLKSRMAGQRRVQRYAMRLATIAATL